MDGLEIHAKILRWGNSYAIRLSKPDAEAAGFRPGMEVDVRLRPPTEPYGVSDLPTFRPIRRKGEDESDAAAGAWRAHQEKMHHGD